MEQAGALFDSIYSRFILRDLFGKIVPGATGLAAISYYLEVPFDPCYLKDLSFWSWLTLSGFAWITGLAIQSTGEFLPIYRYFPKWKDKSNKEKFDRKSWYKWNYNDFLKKATPEESRQIERLVVIKEACGNGFLATATFASLYWLKRGILIPDAKTVVLLIFTIALCIMHLRHVQRQFEVTQTFIKGRSGPTGA